MPRHFGWVRPEDRDAQTQAHVTRLVSAMPLFATKGAPKLGGRLVLWDFARKVTGGRHLPTYDQQIGDCVSMGAANAVNYLACMEIARLGDRERFRPAYQPWIYGISRVQVGKGRIRGDGSIGAWAAEGVKRFGVLAADEERVPPYSGAIARRWGNPPGPPKEFFDEAAPHIVKTTAPVRSYADVRDALLNGYPVTVASMQGFRMRPAIDKGKHWGVPAGEWAHQMAFIGVDDDPKRPGAYCLNSWGESAHGPPADDAPPGGFWVDAEVVERMVRQDDSFAFSQFDGFPEQSLDWLLA